ncbi:FtsB family cell division protein [Cellulosilyticum lentocellum]|uniref:Septum formation initiator n=1 Tax=Cellulosilyticum lentocellum (strain ATCC 49066 / DSM 5427 / NCIMB 11756 / RHM5) TaxID=642492 RepID=F2JS28_CELLD|nr:septum formation initiator family protein [Cellulosilyticum lentocellum]ADZ82842.1 Septum formation initiator [Cellulosilyticum lentocellum DSM 5427]
MRKQKVIILRITFIVTTLGVLGLFVSGQNLRVLNQKVDKELEVTREKVAVQQDKLEALQKEVTDINSKEYIEKVATDQLGMVEEDTIVFREKK